jgi:hypothetical protein
VREESQIDDMRAAVRGDRERAEQARQRSYENVRALTEVPPAEEAPESQRLEPEPPEPVEEQRRRGLLGFLKRR